jgi:hypothetical protein
MPTSAPGPFSVPDDLGDAWDEMIQRNRLIQALTDPDASAPIQDSTAVDQSSDGATSGDDLPVGDWMNVRNQQLAGGQANEVTEDPTSDEGSFPSPSADQDSVVQYAAGDDQLSGEAGTDTLSGIVSDLDGPIRDFLAKDANGKLLHPIGHPGFAESLIPIEGAGREALANYQEGHPILGTLNLGMAGLDATGIGEIGTDALKLGLRFGRSNTWNAVRKAAGKQGLLEAYQHGHHIVPRKFIPDWIPDALTNNWLNILPMKDQVIDGIEHTGTQIHRRLHGRAKVDGQILPKFSPLQQVQYGTKASTRALAGYLPGALVRTGVDAMFDDPDN